MKNLAFALISYWLLFVIVPVGAVLASFGLTVYTLLASGVILLALLVLGERGFRVWKKLWRIT